jgi:hypothetical protein
MRRSALVVSSLAGLAAGCVVFGSSIGAAAALGLSPRSLTVFSAPATVPLSTCTPTAVADAYVDGALLAAGSNFGTAATLSVRSDVLGNRRSLVRFDLTACPDFSNARVTSATMHLVATSAAAGRTYDVHRVTASWSETAVTWNNQPAVAGSATAGTTTAAGQMSWDVAADVSSFAAGSATNFGWRIGDRSEGAAVAATSTFASREDGTPVNRPRLVIEYYP